jgi:hypothetical protein
MKAIHATQLRFPGGKAAVRRRPEKMARRNLSVYRRFIVKDSVEEDR